MEGMDVGREVTSERLLTVDEAAAFLRLSRDRAYALIRDGIIPAVRVGRLIRIVPRELRAFLDAGGRGFERTWRRGEAEIDTRQRRREDRSQIEPVGPVSRSSAKRAR